MKKYGDGSVICCLDVKHWNVGVDAEKPQVECASRGLWASTLPFIHAAPSLEQQAAVSGWGLGITRPAGARFGFCL